MLPKSSRIFLALPLALCATVLHAQRAKTIEPGSPPKIELSHRLPPTASNNLGPAPIVNLGAIDDSLRDAPARSRGVLRVATHRTVAAAGMTQGAWQALSDGTFVWRLDISSTNALGIRVHFTNFSTGLGQVWVHDTNNPVRQTFGAYTGKGRNKSGDFWTEAVFATQVEVEYKPAAGAPTSGNPPFSIAEIVHIWQLGPFAAPRPNSNRRDTTFAASASSFQIVPTARTQAGSPNYGCFVDAACNDSSPVVADAATASAIILFSDYQCSATILNTPNGEPEILTAGHCVNNETDAEGTQAFFNVQAPSCNADNDTFVTNQMLESFPTALGSQLLSSADQPFIGSNYQTEITADIDYSLILLSNFPPSANTVLAGYTADVQSSGTALTSLSYPDGLYMKYAASTIVEGTESQETYFDNAYVVDQSSNGRVDSGSSGSGLFDAGAHIVGLLSTADSCPNPDGSCATNFTSCDVANPFDAWYTTFSSIYPFISQFLEQPLVPNLPTNPTEFYASPDPVIPGPNGYATTTLNVNVPGLTEFQVRLGSPSGALFTQGEVSGTATTGPWVWNGAVFYLQDVSNNNSLTLANTVATVTVNFSNISLTANPSQIPYGTYAATTLSWDAPDIAEVQVHVGSPTGPLFAEGGYMGSATTGAWATAGMTFYLTNQSTGDTITSLSLGTAVGTVDPGVAASLYTSPDPITSEGGSGYGQTTLVWNAPAADSTVEVHVGSPSGPLFARGGNYGSATTGVWVTNGMTFYLQNVTEGLPLTLANTLTTATAVVQ